MLFSTVFTAVLATAALAAPAPVAVAEAGAELVERQVSSCAPVHIIVARGSTEAPGEGSMGAVSNAIKSRVPGATSAGVVYPATLTNYPASEAAGAKQMKADLESYVARCPSTKMVLMGYSQGGQALGDTLLSGSSALPRVFAAVQFGDPTHVAGLSIDKGTSFRNGVFPRANAALLQQYPLQSYCDFNDVFCDSGLSTAVHLSYVAKYTTAAANFVVSKVA